MQMSEHLLAVSVVLAVIVLIAYLIVKLVIITKRMRYYRRQSLISNAKLQIRQFCKCDWKDSKYGKK